MLRPGRSRRHRPPICLPRYLCCARRQQPAYTLCYAQRAGEEDAPHPPSNPPARGAAPGPRAGGLSRPPRTPRAGGFPPHPGTRSRRRCPLTARDRPRRSAVAHARVTPAELAAWKEKAAAAGVPLSELLRRAMARTRTWTARARDLERERLRQLARVGNNLNQLARWANTHKGAAQAAAVIERLLAIQRELDEMRRGGGR